MGAGVFASDGSSEVPGLSHQGSPGRAGGMAATVGPVLSVPDLFLYSMSKPVMMLFPSNRWVQRRFMLRAFTSRISSSGGSGGSGVWRGEGAEVRRAAESLASFYPQGGPGFCCTPGGWCPLKGLGRWGVGKTSLAAGPAFLLLCSPPFLGLGEGRLFWRDSSQQMVCVSSMQSSLLSPADSLPGSHTSGSHSVFYRGCSR